MPICSARRADGSKLLARLGHEAADALDEFLNLALDYERIETPSLQGFVAWLRSAQAEVKRDMEMARDEVRVMTVHGAKGLEAPIVILADTTTPPQGFHPPRLLQLRAGRGPPPLIWATAKANDVGPMGAARETALGEARDEYRRLLYVAMTRAIERLIVCGVDGIRERPEGCWYDLARDTLEPHCVSEPADDGDGEVLRYRKVAGASASEASEGAGDRACAAAAVADAEGHGGGARARRSSRRASSMTARRRACSARARRGGARILRGNILHRLMQSLPDMPPAARAEAARQHIARQDTDFSEAERDGASPPRRWRCSTIARFAALFAPGSRAEVSIVGRHQGRDVSGQIDRLTVTPDEVLIADYKTNRPAPKSLDETRTRHADYVRQLALYRAVLMRLYPGRPVRAALLWTDTPDLMEIPAADLDAALAILTSA